MRGAMILSTAGMATKTMGMMIQVVIARELGEQGFGLFQSINPIFYMLLTVSTLALPPALSKVIAENLAYGNVAKVKRALWIANTTVLVLSSTICISALILAPEVSSRWLDPKAAIPFIGALLRIPVVCLSAVLSGYYMGIQNQTPPAIAWIVETCVRTAVSIPLILFLNRYGISYGALAVVIGAGIGDAAGYVVMLIQYARRDRPDKLARVVPQPVVQSTRHTVRDLIQIAGPTTVTNICAIVAYAAEPLIIYHALAQMHVLKSQATALFGAFGMAIELLLLPTVLSSSISSVLIPAVSEAAAVDNAKLVSKRLNQVVQATFLIALPATVFFLFAGHDLAFFLYKDHLAGELLAYLAPTCVFLYISDPLFAILQGLNKAKISTFITIVTSAIRIPAILYFVGVLHQGIFGVATAAAISGIASTLFALYFVRRYVDVQIHLTNLAKMVIATGVAAIPIHQIQMSFMTAPAVFQAVASALVGCIVYCIALLYLRVVRVRTLQSIPWIGPMMAKMAVRIPFVS